MDGRINDSLYKYACNDPENPERGEGRIDDSPQVSSRERELIHLYTLKSVAAAYQSILLRLASDFDSVNSAFPDRHD